MIVENIRESAKAVVGRSKVSFRCVCHCWRLLFLAVQFVGALYAFRLDGERWRSLWTLPLQQFVYRQLMYLVVFQSIASALYGVRLRWHKLLRTGSMESVPH